MSFLIIEIQGHQVYEHHFTVVSAAMHNLDYFLYYLTNSYYELKYIYIYPLKSVYIAIFTTRTVTFFY